MQIFHFAYRHALRVAAQDNILQVLFADSIVFYRRGPGNWNATHRFKFADYETIAPEQWLYDIRFLSRNVYFLKQGQIRIYYFNGEKWELEPTDKPIEADEPDARISESLLYHYRNDKVIIKRSGNKVFFRIAGAKNKWKRIPLQDVSIASVFCYHSKVIDETYFGVVSEMGVSFYLLQKKEEWVNQPRMQLKPTVLANVKRKTLPATTIEEVETQLSRQFTRSFRIPDLSDAARENAIRMTLKCVLQEDGSVHLQEVTVSGVSENDKALLKKASENAIRQIRYSGNQAFTNQISFPVSIAAEE